jgi:hypothetical protein
MTTSPLTHVAMSVPEGTLTDQYREELLDFYGGLLGWREIQPLRLPDRLTLSVGGSCYLNLRERSDVMVCHGYEHFGIVVDSNEDLARLWARLDGESRAVNLEPLTWSDGGFGSFRFRYMLPMAVELQYIP